MKGAPQNDREAHSTIVRTGSAGLMAKALPLKGMFDTWQRLVHDTVSGWWQSPPETCIHGAHV